MSITRIVVLANSWKHHDWCLAGIDLDTGRWVRPVTDLDDGRVPVKSMKLGGYFPQLLDVLEIPLDSTGPDFGFESENRTILPGRWYLCDRMTPEDIEKYAKRPYYVLHNRRKYVTTTELRQKPFEKRVTLQLIRVDNFKVRDARRKPVDKPNWNGTILSGRRKLEVKITDPVFFERLNSGHKPSPSCFLTMSLGMPYKPPDWDEGEEPVYWKLITGVIELQKKQ
ncbi:MAG: dual OB domain-containing protein [Planctomycetota bacterium]